MHAHDRGAVHETPNRGCERGFFARVDRRVAEHVPEERLARRADEQRHLDARRELGQRGEQREVVLGGLREADARVGEDRVGAHARGDRGVDPRAQLVADFADDVVVVRFGVAIVRGVPRVCITTNIASGVGDDTEQCRDRRCRPTRR